MPGVLRPSGSGRLSEPDDFLQAMLDFKQMKQADIILASGHQRKSEIRAVYLAKRRPALMISRGGPRIKKSLTRDRAKWQTNPTVIVAPYYGSDEGIKRSGFNPVFLERVRLCEYPQFMWDMLPIGGRTKESIMRLDHMQPVGRSQDSIEVTKFCLSDRSLLILDEWLEWLLTGNLEEKTKLCEIRDVLLDR